MDATLQYFEILVTYYAKGDYTRELNVSNVQGIGGKRIQYIDFCVINTLIRFLRLNVGKFARALSSNFKRTVKDCDAQT